MKKPQPQMEWTVDGMDDVMATADDDPTADEVRAALHFDGRVMARLELSPREGPGPKGSKPKFGKKSKYDAPALIYAHEGLLVIHERYQVQVPPGAMNGAALVEMGAKLAHIAASGWTERTVH
jgi:hypothetical protein